MDDGKPPARPSSASSPSLEDGASTFYAAVHASAASSSTNSSGAIGLAYFDATTDSLWCAALASPAEAAAFLSRLQPRAVVANARHHQAWLVATPTSDGIDAARLSFGRTADFSVDGALQRLRGLAIDALGVAPNLAPNEVLLRLMSALDFEAAYMPALGGVAFAFAHVHSEDLHSTRSPILPSPPTRPARPPRQAPRAAAARR